MKIPNLKDEFKTFLNDTGLSLSRPHKQDIVLEDIFVFPNLEQESGLVINSKELLNISGDISRILISGIEDSGKTSLIKMLIKHYLQSGYLPVLIDAQNISLNNSSDLTEIVEKSYKNMYESKSLKEIENDSKKHKVILIDNFDKACDSFSVLGNILEALFEKSDHLIFSMRTVSTVSDDTDSAYLALSDEITRYEIVEFNHERQLELINKWYRLKQESDTELDTLSSKIENTKRIFDTVLENNLVPATPLFLLTILKSHIEDEKHINSESSYCYYYEHLTLKPIYSSIEKKNAEPYLDYLSELSYSMLSQNKELASYKELKQTYDKVMNNRVVEDNLEQILENLIKSETLVLETLYRFKHKYSFHYFVARHLSINIKKEIVQEQINDIFCGIHNDDFAHIILFLTHLADDPLVAELITTNTKTIFSDESLFPISDNSQQIDELIEELSRLGRKDKKFKEAPAQYMASNLDVLNSHLIFEKSQHMDQAKEYSSNLESKRFRAAKNLLIIVRELLNNKYS